MGWTFGERDNGRFLAAAIGLLLGAAALLGCGGGSSESSNAAVTTTGERESGPTEAVLREVGGSGVSGTVVYVKREESALPLVKVRLQGLERARGDKQYFLWQLASRQDMVNIATYNVPNGGRLSVSLEPSPFSLSLLEEGSTTEFLVTKIHNNDRYYEAMEKEPDPRNPALIGVPVARGTFTGPLVGAASAE